jgi:aldose 1-epimerase
MDVTAFSGQVHQQEVSLFRLTNKNRTELFLTNYGARIVALFLTAADGKQYNVVSGFDSLDGYLQSKEVYYGATIGRYANRIAEGRFQLDGHKYSIPVNNGPNHLHGGPNGFHQKVWQVALLSENRLELYLLSPDGEEGFPGNLETRVIFMLSDSDEVTMQYTATTDKPTVINLTNHAYFNLNGLGSGSIENHVLQLLADAYTPVSKTLIPTGAFAMVAGSPFDFRQPKAIGRDIGQDHQQLKFGGGYDHNFVLKKNDYHQPTLAAMARGDLSGITLEVLTTEPGLQLYTGNFLAGTHRLTGGHNDPPRSAFCLETQHFPDAPNQSSFPDTRLDPGQVFSSETIYRFRAD